MQSPKHSADKKYDDRLHIRLGCGKTKAYELLKAYEEGKEWGLRHIRVGAKYIINTFVLFLQPAVTKCPDWVSGIRGHIPGQLLG
ncbi:hypothetical protein GCM10027346_24150 [Hymenobacter seoulensis]